MEWPCRPSDPSARPNPKSRSSAPSTCSRRPIGPPARAPRPCAGTGERLGAFFTHLEASLGRPPALDDLVVQPLSLLILEKQAAGLTPLTRSEGRVLGQHRPPTTPCGGVRRRLVFAVPSLS